VTGNTFVLASVIAIFAWSAADASSSRRSMIVYYANETLESSLDSPNYVALLKILRMDPTVGSELESTLEYDASHFPSIVSRDIKALKSIALGREMDLFVFTNSMTKRDQYLFADSRKQSAETRPLSFGPMPTDTVLENSPLSHSAALVNALEIALADGHGTPTDLYLIVNTHGTDEFAMIPRVAANFVTANPAEVLAQLSANEQSDLSLPLVMSGTRKLAFWHAISDVSARFPVRFPLIFIESCESAPHKWSEVLAIPSAVAAIAHSGFSTLKPVEIDYGKVGGTERDGLGQDLTSELKKVGVRVEPRWLIWIWPLRVTFSQINVLWFFVPMAIWLPASGLAWLRARRPSPKSRAVLRTFKT
jgi:hypothetical protein